MRDEAAREKALGAGAEAVVPHAGTYMRARARIARAHLPDALEEARPDPEWSEISRLVQLAADEGLIAIVGQTTLHPNHMRELIAPWPEQLPRP